MILASILYLQQASTVFIMIDPLGFTKLHLMNFFHDDIIHAQLFRSWMEGRCTISTLITVPVFHYFIIHCEELAFL